MNYWITWKLLRINLWLALMDPQHRCQALSNQSYPSFCEEASCPAQGDSFILLLHLPVSAVGGWGVVKSLWGTKWQPLFQGYLGAACCLHPARVGGQQVRIMINPITTCHTILSSLEWLGMLWASLLGSPLYFNHPRVHLALTPHLAPIQTVLSTSFVTSLHKLTPVHAS